MSPRHNEGVKLSARFRAPQLEELLDEVCRKTGHSRSEVVRDALRRQLTLRLFEEARRKVIPFAEAQGIYTDEDVFKLMS